MEDSTHWSIGGVTLIVADTITTKLALDTGLALEMNGAMSHIIQSYGYLELAAVKLAVLTTVYFIWKKSPTKDTEIHSTVQWIVPRFASTVGVLVTITNSVQVALIHMLR